MEGKKERKYFTFPELWLLPRFGKNAFGQRTHASLFFSSTRQWHCCSRQLPSPFAAHRRPSSFPLSLFSGATVLPPSLFSSVLPSFPLPPPSSRPPSSPASGGNASGQRTHMSLSYALPRNNDTAALAQLPSPFVAHCGPSSSLSLFAGATVLLPLLVSAALLLPSPSSLLSPKLATLPYLVASRLASLHPPSPPAFPTSLPSAFLASGSHLASLHPPQPPVFPPALYSLASLLSLASSPPAPASLLSLASYLRLLPRCLHCCPRLDVSPLRCHFPLLAKKMITCVLIFASLLPSFLSPIFSILPLFPSLLGNKALIR